MYPNIVFQMKMKIGTVITKGSCFLSTGTENFAGIDNQDLLHFENSKIN